MASLDGVGALVQLGFTDLEARVYAFLVGENPATGYRVAQGIGKPVANTYKALQTLGLKGAIEVLEGESRMCRPVPPEELLNRLQRQFQASRERASEALRDLGSSQPDDRVYRLTSYDGVIGRARQMIVEAHRVVIASASEKPAHDLMSSLVEAGRRGVDVAVRAPGVSQEIESVPAGPALYPTELRIATDRTHMLVAALEGDEVLQAITTSSAILASAIHEGLAAEFTLANLRERIEDGAGTKRLMRALESHRGLGTS